MMLSQKLMGSLSKKRQMQGTQLSPNETYLGTSKPRGCEHWKIPWKHSPPETAGEETLDYPPLLVVEEGH